MSPQTYVGKPATLPQAVAVSLRRTQRKVRSGKAKRRRRRNGGRARECALFSARRWCREVGSAARWQWHLVDGFYTAWRLYRREMIPPSTGRLIFVLFRAVCRGSRPVAAGGARPCWAGARAEARRRGPGGSASRVCGTRMIYNRTRTVNPDYPRMSVGLAPPPPWRGAACVPPASGGDGQAGAPRETCLVTTPKLRVHRLLHAYGETGCYSTARTRPASGRGVIPPVGVR